MPKATSDFRNPVCLEMRPLKGAMATAMGIGRTIMSQQVNSNPQEMGSVDSSETFASCNTQPFNSQGDLTSDVVDASCALGPSDSNLYVNPLDKSVDDSPVQPFGRGSSGVKKSASGDTALRSLGASPLDEGFRGFSGIDRGSRGSLNDSPLPKHRKARFQQVYSYIKSVNPNNAMCFLQSARPRTRFGDSTDRPRFESQDSLEPRKSRKTSFVPTRSLASATRIINQHLFGLQSLSGSKSGTYCNLEINLP